MKLKHTETEETNLLGFFVGQVDEKKLKEELTRKLLMNY